MKTADVCRFYSMLHFLIKILFLLLLLVIYCEYLIYYLVLLSCSWPQLSKVNQDFSAEPPINPSQKPLHVMLISDIHLSGSRARNHWFSKSRREWQLFRSFQSAQFLFEPDLIFLLGDISAEGDLCSDKEWNETVQRFNSMFFVSAKQHFYVIPGNHDIGLHNAVTDSRLKRFQTSFHTEHVRLITLADYNVQFVLINSIAFEGDHCRLCAKAEQEFNGVVQELNRTQKRIRPILLSHFPLYRQSNINCSTGPRVSLTMNKERYDVLSQEASEQLLTNLKPRLVFAGHQHDFCYRAHHTDHGKVISEWTIPSFSWRIRDDPSFMLLSVISNNEHVYHCYLPRETTVLWSYAIGCFLVIFYLLFGGRRPFFVLLLSVFKKLIRIK